MERHTVSLTFGKVVAGRRGGNRMLRNVCNGGYVSGRGRAKNTSARFARSRQRDVQLYFIRQGACICNSLTDTKITSIQGKSAMSLRGVFLKRQGEGQNHGHGEVF